MEYSFGFTENDVFINIALFSFDLSVYELLTFAKIGATLLLSDKSSTENPDLFLTRVKKFGGTVWVSTPSFSFLYSRIENSPVQNQVKFFLFCGEMLPNVLAKQLKENYPNTIIYNTYGPTEATVATTLVEITQEIIEKYNPLPVGFPKQESEILIEENEIIIVGKNVSLGYLNRPELNEEKFVTRKNLRAFKTGDNGYFEDGMLFCKGRNDDQVKLHGFRIELNEITAKINEIDFIQMSETIALRRNEEVKKIVSLVELKSNFAVKEVHDIKNEIFNFLKNSLPYYMIPSDIKVIEKIPLNQNGKSDKKALEKIYLAKA
jgi:D-alanine--poly(phosphoribitol) ligase subunit 1